MFTYSNAQNKPLVQKHFRWGDQLEKNYMSRADDYSNKAEKLVVAVGRLLSC